MNVLSKIHMFIKKIIKKMEVIKMNNSFENNNTNFSEEEQNNNQQEDVNSLPEEKYPQWYQKDKERLDLETEKIIQKYPNFEPRILNDSRLCFTGTIAQEEISAICNYNHPLSPPDIFYLGYKEFEFIDESGKIDIFAIDENFRWNPNSVFIVNILEKIEMILRVEKMVRKDKIYESKSKI